MSKDNIFHLQSDTELERFKALLESEEDKNTKLEVEVSSLKNWQKNALAGILMLSDGSIMRAFDPRLV